MCKNVPVFPGWDILHDVHTGKFAGLGTKSEGMTLRDWFAGQALAGLLAYWRLEPLNESSNRAVLVAYQFADAMLAERSKNNGKK
jgi:hypothetical protein